MSSHSHYGAFKPLNLPTFTFFEDFRLFGNSLEPELFATVVADAFTISSSQVCFAVSYLLDAPFTSE